MKLSFFLTAVLLVLLLVSLCAFASAAEIRPLPVDHDRVDLDNGEFCLAVRSADRIEESGYFIAALYLEDHYDAAQVKALVPGDTVLVNDQRWTVKELVIHKAESPAEPDSYEIYPEEEYYGYIAFWPAADGTFIGVMDDWNPVTPVGSLQVFLPLPDRFEYITYSAGEPEEPKGMEAFVDALASYGDSFTAYNTSCVFEDGMLVRVIHSSYPEGPEDTGSQYPVPVWKFCGGVRDGLDTAVITAYGVDCEVGLIPAHTTPEELAEIRSLAMNGTVTGKANDMMTTGGTWLYLFATPGGKDLLSVELYEGLLVGSDGMYAYQP